MNVDVIMLAYTKDISFFNMTQKAINSLHSSEETIKFHIKLIETNEQVESIGKYQNAEVIIPGEKFNYNRFINIGLEKCTNEYVVMCNNDVEFGHEWFKILIAFMKDYGLDSASPYCQNTASIYNLNMTEDVNIGYQVGQHLLGYCIVTTKKVLDTIGKFDERFEFYCQDLDYVMQLKKHGFKQGVVKPSLVNHIFSASHTLFESDSHKHQMTTKMFETFHDKYPSLQSLGLKYETDKATHHNYCDVYEKHLHAFREHPINFLEIGVYKGGSLLMWHEFFKNATIHGVDIDLTNLENPRLKEDRIKLHCGNQQDREFLNSLPDNTLDIVLDDGGHTMQQQMISFAVLFRKLKSGGIYILEDLITSFWPNYGGNENNIQTVLSALYDLKTTGKFSSIWITSEETQYIIDNCKEVIIYGAYGDTTVSTHAITSLIFKK